MLKVAFSDCNMEAAVFASLYTHVELHISKSWSCRDVSWMCEGCKRDANTAAVQFRACVFVLSVFRFLAKYIDLRGCK